MAQPNLNSIANHTHIAPNGTGYITTSPNTGSSWHTTQTYRVGELRMSPTHGGVEMYDGTQWVRLQNQPQVTPTEQLAKYKLMQVLAWIDENNPEIIFDLLMRGTICQEDLPPKSNAATAAT